MDLKSVDGSRLFLFRIKIFTRVAADPPLVVVEVDRIRQLTYRLAA